ncbi:MAG: fluoride efflux transporter CrcB [Solirubrobacteraceae bacterium]
MTALDWVGVALLGSVGALTRFLVDRAISARGAYTFPVGTLAVNASGALLLGMLTGATVSSDALLLAGTATIGSYTTFSTWMFETHRLGEDGELGAGALNVVVSLVVGLAAVAFGRLIGETL